MEKMRRQILSTINAAAEILRDSFEALHSTVRSDYSTISRIGTGWPVVLRELSDFLEPEEERRKFTPDQLLRAEKYCDIFVSIKTVSKPQKKAALIKCLRPHTSWKRVGKAAGIGWTQARDGYDRGVLTFVYAIADFEGVEVERVSLLG